MTILDGVFMGGVVLAILSFIGSGLSLGRYFTKKRKLKQLPKKKSQNKKKRKRMIQQRKHLEKGKKRTLRLFFLGFFLTLCFSGGSSYLSYYQSMNLTANDSDAIVRGYYLLRDFKTQLEEAKEEKEDNVKTQKNIRYLATAMASYGTKKASEVNTKEGQVTLNRYYNALKEVGMNASTQTNNFYGNEQLIQGFLTDSKKVEEYEKAAFSYYKIDETVLSKEK